MTDKKLLSDKNVNPGNELDDLRSYIDSLSPNELKRQLEECGVRFVRKRIDSY